MINKAIIVGRVGQAPELRHTPGGAPVTNFTVATNENWTDKSGKKEERTQWHRIVVWGKLADFCGAHLTKGQQVYVEGKLQTREWEKDGVKRYVTEIQAQTVVFVGGRGVESSSDDGDDIPPGGGL
jgi:single-strand DNA-binding protein